MLVVFVTDLEFKLCHASLQIKKVLLQIGFLGLEGRDLQMKLGVLALLAVIALLHLVLGAEDLLCEGFADIPCFARKHVLKRFLL